MAHEPILISKRAKVKAVPGLLVLQAGCARWDAAEAGKADAVVIPIAGITGALELRSSARLALICRLTSVIYDHDLEQVSRRPRASRSCAWSAMRLPLLCSSSIARRTAMRCRSPSHG